jgi:hypothetical protein
MGCAKRGTALQAGMSGIPFPLVSRELFIELYLPVSEWKFGRLKLELK